MSTLSGIASKGEKGKSKFQSLDINSLYRGESLEPQQKTLPRKHGMQSLGKIPSARRPPANLPSLKSEHSGNDPAISLVPSGGTGWGSKPENQTTQVQPATTNQASSTPTVTTQPPVVVPNVTGATVASTTTGTIQGQPQHTDKSWSSIMAGPGEGGSAPSFLAHQSPLFQQEFPKLSSGDGQAPSTGQKPGSDTQYGPGPSLRPQTEGSWIQGGVRGSLQPQSGNSQSGGTVTAPLPHLQPGGESGGGRSSLAPCAHPPAPLGQVGPSPPQNAAGASPLGPQGLPGSMPPISTSTPPPGPLGGPPIHGPGPGHVPPGSGPHQFRGLIPPFMYRGSFPGPAGFPPNYQGPMHGPPRPRYPYSENRFCPPGRQANDEDIFPRPIIKEEDLNRMDDIVRDDGWATTHDEIDYNKKLAFSDDEESTHEDENIKESQNQKGKDGEDHASEREAENERDRDHDRDDRRDEWKDKKTENLRSGSDQRSWQQGRSGPVEYRTPAHAPPMNYQSSSVKISHQIYGSGSRIMEDEELWQERRRQQSEEVAIVMERAKQRKEEEEKRFQESKQAATKKLKKLEEKIVAKNAENKENEDLDWQREKEQEKDRDRSRTSSEGRDEKLSRDVRERERDYRSMQQTERSSFLRERERDQRSERERERERERGEHPQFSRQFQSNLPPRFQKQQVERQQQFIRSGPQPLSGSGSMAGQQGQSSAPNSSGSNMSGDPRWGNISPHSGSFSFSGQVGGVSVNNVGSKQSNAPSNRRNRTDSDTSGPDREREMLDDRPPSRDQRDREMRDQRHLDARDKDRERERKDQMDLRDRGHTPPDVYDRERERVHDADTWFSDSRDVKHTRNYDSWDQDRDHDYRDSRGFEDRREETKKDPYERHPATQRDSFEERDIRSSDSDRQDTIDWREKDWKEEREKDERERDRRDEKERPQRPDSRDSRASRDSRTSRDSGRDEKSIPELEHKFAPNRELSSWADSPFEPSFDEKERKPYFGREERREISRQPPGPITREKLEAAEQRSETKRNLTQLKRPATSSITLGEKKLEGPKAEQMNKTEKKTESVDAWSRIPKNDDNRADTVPSVPETKSWADTIACESGEMNKQDLNDAKSELMPEPKKEEVKDAQDSKLDLAEKRIVEGKGDSTDAELKKEMSMNKFDSKKDDSRTDMPVKREKNLRSRGSRGRPDMSRGNSRWSSYAVYRGGYARGDFRGRRGGPRLQGGRLRDWDRDRGGVNADDRDRRDRDDESELSGDEISASTESGKEENRGRRDLRRSPRQGKKYEKDEKNREVRKDEKNFKDMDRRYEKRGYENVRSSREGFAPRGEPSRRGRGGFRSRGMGRKMDGYGPPPSKSPFSQPKEEDKKAASIVSEKDTKENRKNEARVESKDDEGNNSEIIGASVDRLKTKPIARRHNRSTIPPRLQRKNDYEPSHGRKGRGRGGNRGDPRRPILTKQNSSDIADDTWETTSENSEVDDKDRRQDRSDGKDIRGANGRKSFSNQRAMSDRQNRKGSNGNMGRGNRGSLSVNVGTSGSSSKAPGAEKKANNCVPNQRNMGLSGSQSSSNHGRIVSRGGPGPGKVKEATVNRVDEIKLNDPNLVSQALSDLSTKKNNRTEKEKTNALERIDLNNYASVVIVDDQPEVTMDEDPFAFDADNGFQEVRSKKTVKERQKNTIEEQKKAREKEKGKGKLPKQPFERPRQNKLPPRLAKQRENNRLQKAQQQAQGHPSDVTEMNKINQNVSLFPLKDSSTPAPPPTVNAWEKPITATLRPNSPSSNVTPGVQMGSSLSTSENSIMSGPAQTTKSSSFDNHDSGIDVNDQPTSAASSQRSSPSNDPKSANKATREAVEKTVLDGTNAPVQTIIFENTNFKSSPSDIAMKAKYNSHMKNQRMEKNRERKINEGDETAHTVPAYSKASGGNDLGKSAESKNEPIQLPLSFAKNEDSADMKLDFTFDSELTQLTEEKSVAVSSKSIAMPRSIHMAGSVQSPISPSAELDFKIASVKKVWENMPTVLEHSEDGSCTSTSSSFTPTFGNPVDTGLDASSFSKNVDNSVVAGEESSASDVGYSSGPSLQGSNSYSGSAVSTVTSLTKNDPISTSSNVCKVKPQQQAVISAGPSPIGPNGPLSPPPFNSSSAQAGHMSYQPTLGGTAAAAQFGGLSAVPSPPTVLFNSSQQIPGQGGLYGQFQIESAQVIGGQARSQFSQYPPYGMSQGLGQTSAFNQQSMYLSTAPHPPPSAAPDMYPSSLSQYRIQATTGPFGQSQHVTSNPSTVLISSTSNSLMSASVKPSSQQIGAIGTKGGGPFQQSGLGTALQSAPQPSPLYIQYDPSQVLNVNQNYLSNSQMVQRPGPVQSSVVQAIQPPTSFYSGSAGGQTGYYQTGSSTLQAVQQQAPTGPPLHQTAGPFGLQGYSTQSGTAAVGLQNFSSQIAAQPFRSTGLPGNFLKSGGQHPTDHGTGSGGRAQLKSPSSSQDVLASVLFSTASHISSPKSRNQKQQQQSPTQQHQKFNNYQSVSQSPLVLQSNVRGQMAMSVRGAVPPTPTRYPAPIQRPVAFQQPGNAGSMTGSGSGGRHRLPHTQRPSLSSHTKLQGQTFFGSQGIHNVKMEGGTDGKVEDSGHPTSDNKLNDGNSTGSNNSGTTNSTKQGGISSPSPTSQPSELKIVQEASLSPKEESTAATTE